MFTVQHYITGDEYSPLQEWLRKLRDPIAKGQVVRRVGHIETGNFDDHKLYREGAWELRINQGPGYRVYYTMTGTVVVLLLCGGDKGTQDADIEHAIGFWKGWRRKLV